MPIENFDINKLSFYKENGYFTDGIASVIKDGKIGFIKLDGSFLFPEKYLFKLTGKISEGFVAVSSNLNKWGVIKTDGSFLIPCIFDGIGDFSDGVVMFRTKENIWGYMNTLGLCRVTGDTKDAKIYFKTLEDTYNIYGIKRFILEKVL